jgi:hypothetical protein
MNPVFDGLIFVIAFFLLVRQNWAPPAEPESQSTGITAALGRESAEVLTLSHLSPCLTFNPCSPKVSVLLH